MGWSNLEAPVVAQAEVGLPVVEAGLHRPVVAFPEAVEALAEEAAAVAGRIK